MGKIEIYKPLTAKLTDTHFWTTCYIGRNSNFYNNTFNRLMIYNKNPINYL